MIEITDAEVGLDLIFSRGPGQTIQIRVGWNEAAELFHALAKLYVDKPAIEALIPDD